MISAIYPSYSFPAMSNTATPLDEAILLRGAPNSGVIKFRAAEKDRFILSVRLWVKIPT